MKRSMFRSESGVSESLGSIFIFGIFFISFACIIAIMYPIYNNYIDQGHMSNMIESFDILAYNGNNVALHNLPYASSEIKMYGGSLATRNIGYINISCYSNDDITSEGVPKGEPMSPEPYHCNVTILEYSKNNDTVAYLNGGVYISGNSGPIMMREPLIYNTDDAFIYNDVALKLSQVSISGNGPIQISVSTPFYSNKNQSVSSVNTTYFSDVHLITFTIKGDYSAGISRYLEQRFNFVEFPGNDGETNLSKAYPEGAYPNGIKLYIVPNYLVVEAK